MVWAGLVTFAVGAAVSVFAVVGPESSGLGIVGAVVMAVGALTICAGLVRRHRLRARRRAGLDHDVLVAGPGIGRSGTSGRRPAADLRESVYRTSKGRIAAMVIAAVYIVSPIDFVPDFLLPVGIVDDATALGWLVFAVSREYGRRRRARSPQEPIAPKPVIPGQAMPSSGSPRVPVSPPRGRSPR